MRAMVLTAPGELVLDDVARPVANAREVLVRVTHSGICGTDYKIFNGSIPVRYPRIMGHEMSGEVVDPGDTAFRAGDHVIIDPELWCGVCFHCRVGQTNLCPNGQLLGRDANGGFAEYLAAPVTNVFPLPVTIDRRAAPMIQVLTTCLHAQRQIEIKAWRLASIATQDRIVIARVEQRRHLLLGDPLSVDEIIPCRLWVIRGFEVAGAQPFGPLVP